MGAEVAALRIQHEPIQPWWTRKALVSLAPLKNTESEVVSWARRTENFVASVHPGAKDVLTWAVERESATVTEANAATEGLMPLDTLRMLADRLYTVLMTFVEGESFDILVGSRPERRARSLATSAQTTGPPDDGKSKRLAQRDPVSWTCQVGRAARSSGTVGGVDEASHAEKQAEDIRMAALEALLPEELERHCHLQRSRSDKYLKLREEVVLCAQGRGYVAPQAGSSRKGSRGQR